MKRKTRPGLYTTKLLVLTHACSVDAVDDFSRGDRTLQLLLQPAGHVLTPQLRLLLRPIPVPVRHGHQPPVGSAELPALEERPARRHAAQEVTRPVHLVRVRVRVRGRGRVKVRGRGRGRGRVGTAPSRSP